MWYQLAGLKAWKQETGPDRLLASTDIFWGWVRLVGFLGGGGAQGAGAGTGQELEQERTGKAETGAAETGRGRNRKRYGDSAGRRSAKSRGCSYSCGLFFSPGRRLAAPWQAYMAFLSEPFLSLPFLSVLVPATAFLLTSLLYCSRAFSSLEASSVGTSSPCLPWVSRRSVR